MLGGGRSGQLDLDADAELYGAGNDAAGRAVSGAGDTDGDGLADFLVGVALSDTRGSSSGTSYLFEGGFPSTGSLSSNAAASWTGEATNDRSGSSVAGVGDVNADGYDDVAIGASEGAIAGRAYVLFGPFSGTSALSTADVTLDAVTDTGSNLGVSLCGADVDGDGTPEVVVGDYADSTGGTGAGAVWIFDELTAGSYDTDDAGAWIGGTGDEAGTSLACGGDTDGDGREEIVTGGMGADTLATDGGMAALLR